jgi:hypothetical protein
MEPDVTTERVAMVTMRLLRGERGTTMEIAAWVGLTRFGAWEMLMKIARVLPLTLVDGCWQIANQELVE